MIKNSIPFLLEVLTVIVAAFFLISCSDDDDPEVVIQNSVELANLGSLGDVLVDGEGRTLYFFSNDASGESACSGGCIESWPVFYEAALTLGDGLGASGFDAITRDDGSKQTTYKGWPLYYFAGDVAAGETNGEGVGNNWFVAKPDYTVMIAIQEIDGVSTSYLVNDLGRSLFFFANDEENVSNCSGGCLDAWPVFDRDVPVVAPSILNTSGFGQIDSNNGGKQLTYQSKPLYYFAQDTERGQISGNDVANWSVAGI